MILSRQRTLPPSFILFGTVAAFVSLFALSATARGDARGDAPAPTVKRVIVQQQPALTVESSPPSLFAILRVVAAVLGSASTALNCIAPKHQEHVGRRRERQGR